MTEVDKFYVNNPNRSSRFYYVLGKFGDNYDYILWDQQLDQFKYGGMEWLIDNNPFLITDSSSYDIEKLKYIFMKGVFTI